MQFLTTTFTTVIVTTWYFNLLTTIDNLIYSLSLISKYRDQKMWYPQRLTFFQLYVIYLRLHNKFITMNSIHFVHCVWKTNSYSVIKGSNVGYSRLLNGIKSYVLTCQKFLNDHPMLLMINMKCCVIFYVKSHRYCDGLDQ